jgi:hypothetical protein
MHQPIRTKDVRGETNSAATLANGPTLTGTPQRQHEPVPLMPKQTRTSLSNSGGSNVGNTIAECPARNSKADCKVNSQLDHTTLMSTLGVDDLRCETSGNDATPPRQTWIVKPKHKSEQKSRTRKRASAPKMDASAQNGGIAQNGGLDAENSLRRAASLAISDSHHWFCMSLPIISLLLENGGTIPMLHRGA